MEMLMISFAAAWMLRSWWDGRRADYRDPDNGYQQCTGRREPRRSGPDTRYAMGWSAWQLRHGWPAMIEDVRRGYSDAQATYKAWREGDDTERPGMGDAWKRGWRKASTKLPKTRKQQAAAAEAAAQADAESPATEQAPSIPVPAPPNGVPFGKPTIGGSMTAPTGETTGITPYREHLRQTIDFAVQRIDAAQAEISNAEQEIAAHENSHASLGAAGMGAETTGDVAELIESALARKQAAEGRLAAAEKSKADAERALANLDQQGHTTVEEGVKGATAKVADTSFYEN
jgi:hypothetical protein